MTLSLLNNILLREKADPNLSAKGSSLTWDEEDTNFVIIRDAIKELSTSSADGFDEYDNSKVYSNVNPDYVVYEGNIWKYINPTPASGVTPGTNVLYWEISSQGLFSHEKNKDSYLAKGTEFEVSAEDLFNLLDNYAQNLSDVYDYIDSEIAGVDLSALWNLSGNVFDARKKLGSTSGNFGFDFVKENTVYGGLSDTAKWYFGTNAAFADTDVSVKGSGNTSGTYAFQVQNSDNSANCYFRNDGLLFNYNLHTLQTSKIGNTRKLYQYIGVGDNLAVLSFNRDNNGTYDTPSQEAPQIGMSSGAGSSAIIMYSGAGVTEYFKMANEGVFSFGTGTAFADTRFSFRGRGSAHSIIAQFKNEGLTADVFSILENGNINVGSSTSFADTRVSVLGQGNTSATYASQEQASDSTVLRWTRNDGLNFMKEALIGGTTKSGTNNLELRADSNFNFNTAFELFDAGGTSRFQLRDGGNVYMPGTAFVDSSDRNLAIMSLSTLYRWDGAANRIVMDWSSTILNDWSGSNSMNWQFRYLAVGGTEKLNWNSNYFDGGNWDFRGTGAVKVPVGTTAQRVATQGMIRYNTSTSKFEGYDGTNWQDFH